VKHPIVRTAAGWKEPIYFGSPSRPLFGFYHGPGDGWRDAAVVLCNPLGTDQTRSERTYRHLAERLAAMGFPCLRYDHFGTGDSGGDETSPDLVRAWIEDVGVACDELRARSGVRSIALVGLRLGASLALLSAAERGNVDSLVLWSPCASGAAFVAEVTKLHKVYARIEPHLAAAPPPRGDGEEALGYFFPRALIDGLSGVDLLRTSRRPARRTLLIDGGNLPSQGALVDRLRDLGAAPELERHPGHKFLITVSHRALVPAEVIDSIAAWLAREYPETASPGGPPPRDATHPSPSGERAVIFGEEGRLFGILTPANPMRARAVRPPIVLANAGCVNRSGPHRIYTRMARRWAELGFDVFRVDLSGIGDTPAPPHSVENLPYPPSALEDLSDAITALRRERVIVCGLCSGGDYAFQLGARDNRIAGAWMLNPRTFCVLDLAAVESADGAPPPTSVEDVPRMLRAMADRGVDTLLVVSRNDPGVAYVDVHAPEAMRALVGTPGFERVDLDGTDHTFTPVGTQEAVSDLLTRHLDRRYGSLHDA
jgi:alpha-beta hydrolase superfamily lysophospholipase